MNDRFKFRVWLPSLNKFGSDNSVFMDCYGKLYGVTRPSLVDDSRSIVNIGQFKEFSGHTIQWYTGLNDKDNNAIFEGDLVKIKSHKDYENEVFQVGFENGSFYLKSCDHAGFVTIGKYAYDAFWNDTIDDIDEANTLFEVVGNINDNPELMK